jgi:serine phosphatase RsbU (regulator of sigma subunit)
MLIIYEAQIMHTRFLSIAKFIWPDIDTLSEQRKIIAVGEIITFLYSIPLVIAGLSWLIVITAPNLITVIRQEWSFIFLVFGLIFVFDRLSFFYIVEIRENRYGSTSESFSTMVHWSAVFLLGPSAIWIIVVVVLSLFIWRWFHTASRLARWNLLRNLNLTLVSITLAKLIALNLYQALGGQFPIPSLSLEVISIAITAITLQFILTLLFSSGYLLYHIYIQKNLDSSNPVKPLLVFILFSYGLPYLSHPFAILAAGLYVQNGFEIYLFFLVGMLLVAYLARKLSWLAESSRQQSRQLRTLEILGRDIINAPLDASTLPEILDKHLSTMFPSGSIAIWLSPDQSLFQSPSDWPSVQQETWDWLLNQEQPHAFLHKDPLPWNEGNQNHNPVIVTPILTPEANRPIGGIYLELRTLAQPWDFRSLSNLFPALQSLAALIASALHRAEIYAQTLTYQEISQELKLAGSIQASFLPNKFPAIPGWQLAVSLLPARETSGDFFDVIELSNGKLGILIADVADKGVGPALYMALSRTLIRTYAEEYDAEPDVVFYATNQRLHRDARANLFVTAFYGILDPQKGTLSYSNAGHNPPFLIKSGEVDSIKTLGRTGIPLGVEIDTTWSQSSVNIDPGDVLLLYTDGIPDAQNEQGLFFDDDRLIELAQKNLGAPAHELQNAILTEVQNFIGKTTQFDDITLMTLVRDS